MIYEDIEQWDSQILNMNSQGCLLKTILKNISSRSVIGDVLLLTHITRILIENKRKITLQQLRSAWRCISKEETEENRADYLWLLQNIKEGVWYSGLKRDLKVFEKHQKAFYNNPPKFFKPIIPSTKRKAHSNSFFTSSEQQREVLENKYY